MLVLDDDNSWNLCLAFDDTLDLRHAILGHHLVAILLGWLASSLVLFKLLLDVVLFFFLLLLVVELAVILVIIVISSRRSILLLHHGLRWVRLCLLCI